MNLQPWIRERREHSHLVCIPSSQECFFFLQNKLDNETSTNHGDLFEDRNKKKEKIVNEVVNQYILLLNLIQSSN